MGKKSALKRVQNTSDEECLAEVTASIWSAVQEQVTEIFLFLMLAVYPLFIVNSYEDLVYKKRALFLYASIAFIMVSFVCGMADRIRRKRSRGGSEGAECKPLCGTGKRLLTDYFAAAYLLCAFISYGTAVDKETGLWGIDTWYMGLLAQILFVGIYFAIARGYREKRYRKVLAAVVGIIVSGIVILQRFGVNVWHLYDGYGEDVKLNFVTTLGQVTWSSSYISILLVAGMGIYYLTKERKAKIFWGICIGIGYAAELLLNCDSGVIALVTAWMIMLWISFGDRGRILSLLETVLIALAVTAGIGILERIFAQRMVPIDEVYLKLAQSSVVYVLLLIVAVVYRLIQKGKLSVGTQKRTIRICRGIYICLLCLAVVGVAVLFVLHEKNYFNGSPTENYFRFTIWWGNSRGFIWRTGAAVFRDFDLWRKLFGCGPDCFTPYAYELMGAAMDEFWHNQIVPNVHNEWFNALINYGMAGGTAYLGIFVSAACGFMKRAVGVMENTTNLTEEKWKQADGTVEPVGERNRAMLFGIGLAAAGYVAHNVLCYQQLIGTPLIFVLLGIGAAISRKSKF